MTAVPPVPTKPSRCLTDRHTCYARRNRAQVESLNYPADTPADETSPSSYSIVRDAFLKHDAFLRRRRHARWAPLQQWRLRSRLRRNNPPDAAFQNLDEWIRHPMVVLSMARKLILWFNVAIVDSRLRPAVSVPHPSGYQPTEAPRMSSSLKIAHDHRPTN